MAGDDRTRYCTRCNLNVYNLAVMKRGEVELLFRAAKGRVCGRLYVRKDRTATLRECAGSRARKTVRRAAAVAIILALGAFSWIMRGIDEPDRSIHPTWVRKVLDWIEPERRSMMLAGDIAPPPPPAR
jgi:hypothetical protein